MSNPTGSQLHPIKIFGIGSAGIAVLNRLMDSGLPGAEFVAVNTDAVSLESTSAPEKLLLESKQLRGLGTGGDPGRGARAAEDNLKQLEALCQGTEMVFIVTGLGGGTGTGVSPVIARAARQAGALVTGFAFLPFDCEGDSRSLNAVRGLEALKAAADGVICLPNQRIFKLIDEDSSITETFEKVGGLLADGVRAVWRLMNVKGLLELSYEDLSSVLRDCHSENLFAVAESSGSERVSHVLQELKTHPLLDGGKDLARADTVLVSVTSGAELSMGELNRLMAEINEISTNARVSMGSAVSEEFAGRLVVTVIVACRPSSRQAESQEERIEMAGSSRVSEAVDGLPAGSPTGSGSRRTSRTDLLPPPPNLPADRVRQVAKRQGVFRKSSSRLQQGQLPLEVVSKGRFEKGEPTILHGEDLDMPTYIRRGVTLN